MENRGERDIKEFLYAFLMKNYRIPPVYDVNSMGTPIFTFLV